MDIEKRIENILRNWKAGYPKRYIGNTERMVAREIKLLFKGYVKLSKNQDIPENPYELYSYGARIQHQEEESKGFKCCAEQMIKGNFRRVEIDG